MYGVRPPVQRSSQEEFVLDMHDYLRILRRSWILVVATALTGLLVGAAVSLLTKPTYASNTQLFVALNNSASVQDLQQADSFGQARVQSYVKTVTTPVVLQPAIDSLGLSVTADALARQVEASADPNTVLINISVTNESAARAADIAQAVAISLTKAVDKLEKPTTGNSPVSLSMITPAKVATHASTPNTPMNLIFGLIVGLALGVGIAILRSVLDNRIRSEADLRLVTSAPLLGGTGLDADAFSKPLLTQIDQQSPRAESFRQLRTNLEYAINSSKATSILVTSSIPGEGKTTTATNLAIAIAQTGRKVCLVDADLRRPQMCEYLGLDGNAGLSAALSGDADVKDVLQHWGPDTLYVLPSGQIPPNPSELLGSADLKALIVRLESEFDIVILDAPPVLRVSDATVLAQHVGGVLVVVNAQVMRQRMLVKTLSALELVGSNVLGVVLTHLPKTGPDAYPYTYRGYSAAKDEGHMTMAPTPV